MMNLRFFLNSFGLGVGLAMDAFSVSLVNGMREPEMRKSKLLKMAGVFALFQCAMPLIGWLLVKTVVETFKGVSKYIPWIAFALLLFIGGKMLVEGIMDIIHKNKAEQDESGADLDEAAEAQSGERRLTKMGVLGQGIATSIDALSVGFAIANYNRYMALVSGLTIGVTTFVVCVFGGVVGKKIGTALSSGASILGGCILIIIGFTVLFD